MQDFKDFNPNFLRVALKWLGVFVLVLIIAMFVRACDQKEKSPVQDEITIVKPPIVHHYVDDSGKQHAEVAAIVAPVVNNLDNHYQHIIDSLTKVIKAKPKAVQSAVMIGTETEGDFVPTITPPSVVKNDSAELLFYNENASVDYHDKYLTIHGKLNKDSNWSYKVVDSLSVVTYLKKKGWFGHQLYLDALAQNPNTSIKGITGIEITGYKPHKWGIGVQVGYGWNGLAFSPIVSVGLQRSFIRF